MASKILITGGAGFVGANLAVALAARHPEITIVALDNLFRRGSELNLPRLREAQVTFVHGDVRNSRDLMQVGAFDALVECSAEPSVLAGTGGGDPGYVFETNLVGAYNCLEAARRHEAQLVFLSTSRVYPVAGLLDIRLIETATRFEIAPDQTVAGVSPAGISETFPLAGARTLYGTTKLSAELLIAEYAATYGLRACVNRCGVIAGPWQMGKVDQGVFTYWMLAHVMGMPLSYIGFGGRGLQVRDLLHVDDLIRLVDDQLSSPDGWAGTTVNVGGGRSGSLSLKETTELCREISGTTIEVGVDPDERPGDVPIYISDVSRLEGLTSWRPQWDPRSTLEDIHRWIYDNQEAVRTAL